jgi:hypothetical protein
MSFNNVFKELLGKYLRLVWSESNEAQDLPSVVEMPVGGVTSFLYDHKRTVTLTATSARAMKHERPRALRHRLPRRLCPSFNRPLTYGSKLFTKDLT